MPVLKLISNESFLNTDEILLKTSSLVSQLLGKPEKYVMVIFHENPDMFFGGSDKPMFYIEMKSIGLPRNKTKEISEKLMQLLYEETGVPTGRMYIEFSDAEGKMWGWDKTTF